MVLSRNKFHCSPFRQESRTYRRLSMNGTPVTVKLTRSRLSLGRISNVAQRQAYSSRISAVTTQVLCIAILAVSQAWSQDIDIEAKPIEYSNTPDQNVVRDLIRKLKSGETTLGYESRHGYLRSLLKALDIPVSSQVLVFSKTSMQIQYISRRNPRAIYFNDNTYVGWVRGSSIMEISTNDPNLGAAFYTVEMSPRSALVRRENYNCLACHISTMTQGIPGHTVRSVFPKADGTIDFRTDSFVTDHRSPFSERWGGWYVTGLHGKMKHMGNSVLRGTKLDTSRNSNLKNLRGEFDTLDWLSPYSDIVALMVLEHQTQMHNSFTRSSFAVRQATYNAEQASGGTIDSDSAVGEELDLLVKTSAKDVVDNLLFCGEAKLDSEVSGSMVYRDEFVSRGPVDSKRRSLREFDLTSRMFKYPCSYLVYSDAFDTMPTVLHDEVIRQLREVLEGENISAEYAHLTPATRATILEILHDTKDGF